MWWAAVACCLFTRSHAADDALAAAFAKRLIRARTAGASHHIRATYESARVADLSCEVQRARNLAPISCYEHLALAKDWGVRSGAAYLRDIADLDGRCAQTASRLRVPRADVNLNFVSPRCASRVRDARATLKYRDAGQDWPED